LTTDKIDKIESVHIRHHEICDNGLEAGFGKQSEGFRSIRGGCHVVVAVRRAKVIVRRLGPSSSTKRIIRNIIGPLGYTGQVLVVG